MLRSNQYKNKDKLRKTKRNQKERYRNRNGANTYEKRQWSHTEDYLVLAHSMPDTELSVMIKRSVGAIQTRRVRLRKKCLNDESEI